MTRGVPAGRPAEVAAEDRPLVTPRQGRHTPRLAPLAVMVANGRDLSSLGAALGLDASAGRNLFTSRLLLPAKGAAACALVGPLIGAPYAVMLLETLVAWGAREIVFLGWCGALAPDLAVGDLLLPEAALIDEGTSRHYRPRTRCARPATTSVGRLRQALEGCAAAFRTGAVWTTDGVFRETPAKVRRFREKGALAVEMELSALFSAGKHLRVPVAGLLVVSDLLSGPSWRPGFKEAGFDEGRRTAVQVIERLCQTG